MKTRMEYNARVAKALRENNHESVFQPTLSTPKVTYQGYDWGYVYNEKALKEKQEHDLAYLREKRKKAQEARYKQTLKYKIRHFLGLE